MGILFGLIPVIFFNVVKQKTDDNIPGHETYGVFLKINDRRLTDRYFAQPLIKFGKIIKPLIFFKINNVRDEMA
ncbi:hypothetical protein L7E55_13805 [Pelotomaculum isophthalicicum JI]|uniref:Uncharacterized protein n=1 Tax=Pelotomaculum isophthalicicum JI TaxID=947010 RepID=A0A9X4JW30_9FIRM|nr:hypothetical protein [Pelotomaculum isophthalicicum]MDF9409416.1 hypothetical protein [Pelotomaculum isophthalicicum JI]